jgi:hypothetical protein
MLTNKKMSEALDIPLYKIRRWTKELLPPDPKATRRSGYAREFTINDGFFVYLGGFFVLRGYVFYEVRNILEPLKPYLLMAGLVPDIPIYAKREGIEIKMNQSQELEIYEFNEKPGEFYITCKGQINREVSWDVDDVGRNYANIETKKVEYWIISPPQAMLDEWNRGSGKRKVDGLGWKDQKKIKRSITVDMDGLLSAFIFRISGSIGDYWEWERKFWALNDKSSTREGGQ